MSPIKITIVVCGYCGKILRDVPEVFENNPAVDIQTSRGICPNFCHQMLGELRQMVKHLESLLNKGGGRT